MELPQGFAAHVVSLGIKDHSDDFVLVACADLGAAAGVFTRSRFAGPSVIISREHLADLRARAVVVVSKNANVATGAEGLANAREVVAGVARAIGCDERDVAIASTGVIGRQYPMERIRAGLAALPAWPAGRAADDVARGIMTTDTVPKTADAIIGAGPARVVGVAKGVGMIEPDMATLISLVFTDAAVDGPVLDGILRRTVDVTFNCVSVDTDTSTSDSVIAMSSGVAGPVDAGALEAAVHDVLRSLARQVARDGEGAETLIEVRVDGARDRAQAKRVAKSIVNSPLVKTAVHGADPNWGRVAMAVGKCSDDTDIDESRVVIRFGDMEVYPAQVDAEGLERLSDYMRGDEVLIHVSLGTGTREATVWGCDLTDGYVRINADYTT